MRAKQAWRCSCRWSQGGIMQDSENTAGQALRMLMNWWCTFKPCRSFGDLCDSGWHHRLQSAVQCYPSVKTALSAHLNIIKWIRCQTSKFTNSLLLPDAFYNRELQMNHNLIEMWKRPLSVDVQQQLSHFVDSFWTELLALWKLWLSGSLDDTKTLVNVFTKKFQPAVTSVSSELYIDWLLQNKLWACRRHITFVFACVIMIHRRQWSFVSLVLNSQPVQAWVTGAHKAPAFKAKSVLPYLLLVMLMWYISRSLIFPNQVRV